MHHPFETGLFVGGFFTACLFGLAYRLREFWHERRRDASLRRYLMYSR